MSISPQSSASHFVYILLSAHSKYYIGYTTNLERRLKQHQTGKGAKFTRSFGAMQILYHEEFSTRSEALKREATLKKLTRAQKEKLITANQSDS